MLLVAIDPGLRHCALAVFADGADGLPRLCWAGLIFNPQDRVRGPLAWEAMARAVLEAFPLRADVFVVELPQFDGRTSGGVVPDVFEVVGVAGKLLAAFAGRVDEALALTPAEWKRNLPKAVTDARVAAALSPEESSFIEDNGALNHNTIDAIAIGLFVAQKRAKDGIEEAA